MIAVTIADTEVRAALAALSARVTNLRPFMQALGEDVVERARQRFVTGTGPDGQRWRPNTQTTVLVYLARRGGFGKRGRITARGQTLAITKRPLIGESGDLRRQFHVTSDAHSVIVANSAVYAAIQQFGGSRARYPHLWGDIPARPFLPVRSDGELYPAEQRSILVALNEWLGRD